MYTTKAITKEVLKKTVISNQDEIKALTGSELNLINAMETIKKESGNYTKENAKALEADKLLYQVVHPSEKNKPSDLEKNKIEIQEKERARALLLLELELELLTAA